MICCFRLFCVKMSFEGVCFEVEKPILVVFVPSDEFCKSTKNSGLHKCCVGKVMNKMHKKVCSRGTDLLATVVIAVC